MKMKKSLLAVLLSMLFMFSSFVPSISCYAVSISDINTYFDVQGKFYQILKRVTDISTTQEHQTSILNRMYDLLESGGYNGSRSGQGLEQNGDVTINTNGDVILSVDLQNAIRESTQTEIDDFMGFTYVYTFSGADFLNNFLNQTAYHSFLDVLNENSGSLIYVSCPNSSHSFPEYIGILKDNTQLVRNGSDVSVGTPTYTCTWYLNWVNLSYSDMLVKNYFYDSSSSTYVLVDNTSRNGSGSAHIRQYNNGQSITNCDYKRFYCSLNRSQIILYNSFDAMRSGTEGLQDYYVGNDFSTSTVSTTQTITDSMLNSSITYGDISNYVNSYYVTNQSYPTTENVYNYINNYNGSGGGSGDDNGNGSDDNNNIWDFLGGIGDFIGNLISALGNVLSGILSLLTDVIDMFIGENGLPNIVGQLIQYFLPFLPTEIVQLIEFSLLLAIILGVIRLIRGH